MILLKTGHRAQINVQILHVKSGFPVLHELSHLLLAIELGRFKSLAVWQRSINCRITDSWNSENFKFLSPFSRLKQLMQMVHINYMKKDFFVPLDCFAYALHCDDNSMSAVSTHPFFWNNPRRLLTSQLGVQYFYFPSLMVLCDCHEQQTTQTVHNTAPPFHAIGVYLTIT